MLKKKSDEVRSSGDLKLLERLRAEADAWEMKGELPKLISTRLYEDAVRKSRMKMEDAFKTAVKEYTKADNIERAKATEMELDEFKSGRQPLPPQAAAEAPTKQKLREFLEVLHMAVAGSEGWECMVPS